MERIEESKRETNIQRYKESVINCFHPHFKFMAVAYVTSAVGMKSTLSARDVLT
jgi:hypothetical protein